MIDTQALDEAVRRSSFLLDECERRPLEEWPSVIDSDIRFAREFRCKSEVDVIRERYRRIVAEKARRRLAEFVASQEPLGADFENAIRENISDLYAKGVIG